MRRIVTDRVTWVGALLLAVVATPTFAQQKIGFVNTLQVLNDSEEGKARIAAWNDFFKGKSQEIERETAKLQQMQQQFAEQQLSLAPDAQAEMQRKIQDLATRVKRMQEDANREAEKRRNTILQEISAKMREILEEYGEANQYAAIFLLNPDQQVYVAGALDISDEILRIYNERHPLTGGGGQ